MTTPANNETNSLPALQTTTTVLPDPNSEILTTVANPDYDPPVTTGGGDSGGSNG